MTPPGPTPVRTAWYTTSVEGRLDGKVAVVTGASRGIGKGIALELGAAGATVFVTGRTVTADDQPLPGTVGETAAEIDSLGGRGVALACDHHVDAQVEAVFEQVRRDSGRLDVLVNNVFSSPAMVPWLGRPFWELPIEAWDETIDIGVRSHYVASRYAVPLLFAAGGGVIVNVSSSGAIQYAHNVPYGVGKAAVDKMTADMAHELAGHAVAVVSVWPGLVRTELVSMGARETEDGRQVLGLPGEGEFDLADAESPRFTGRAVVALATDRDVMDRSGRAFPVAGLADDYGFTDVDGGRGGVRLRPEPDGG
jgi:dehydrogenase/reductase SDR family protein 1